MTLVAQRSMKVHFRLAPRHPSGPIFFRHPSRPKGLEALTEAWMLAEKKLGDAEWALGSWSIVDIHLFRLYWRMVNSPGDRPMGLTRLDAHYARMMARPAVQKTIEAEKAVGYDLPR